MKTTKFSVTDAIVYVGSLLASQTVSKDTNTCTQTQTRTDNTHFIVWIFYVLLLTIVSEIAFAKIEALMNKKTIVSTIVSKFVENVVFNYISYDIFNNIWR